MKKEEAIKLLHEYLFENKIFYIYRGNDQFYIGNPLLKFKYDEKCTLDISIRTISPTQGEDYSFRIKDISICNIENIMYDPSELKQNLLEQEKREYIENIQNIENQFKE